MDQTQFEPGEISIRKQDELIGTGKPTPNGGARTLGPFALNTVHEHDCITAMRALPDQSVDVAVVDPPYNASKGNRWKWDNSVALPGFGGDWDKVMAEWDSMPLGEYFSFTLQWLAELKRVVRPTGSLWIHGTYHNIGIINFALQLLEIEIINEVVWYKRNSFPNLSGRRLTASHETVLWAHTGRGTRKYLFNYEASKNTPFPDDALKVPGNQMRTVWDISNNKTRDELRYGKHPTQKPVRLIKRLLTLSAQEGQLCLVPFAGAGSECVAAREMGLDYLGFETDPEYVSLCGRRLRSVMPAPVLPHLDIPGSDEQPSDTPSGQPKGRPAGNSGTRAAAKKKPIPSLIKWTGSKRSQAHAIFSLAPSYRRYIEPFLGGGALLYLAAQPGSVGGDIYQPLIELWLMVQRDSKTLVEDYRQQWEALHRSLPDYFYEVRERFNQRPNPLDLNFLMRTCVNGIVRFNDVGEFNNSFHLSRPGMHPERFAGIVSSWTDRLREVEFVCQDFTQTVSLAREGDFVYLDPPYAGNKQRYTRDLNIEQLYATLESLNSRGVKWALSFDGQRGETDLAHPIPESLYSRKLLLASGNSAVGKVLNGPIEFVHEALYLNY